MNINKIKITESELKQIVSESVKKILNEISSDLAYNASRAAYNKGRTGQGNTFSIYGDKRLKDELSLPSDVEANQRYIRYKSNSGRAITLGTNGVAKADDITFNGFKDWTGANNENSASFYLKVDDKRLARDIANWCSKYIGDNFPQTADWHFWAKL